MSSISSDILLISADPRGLGGKPGVLTVEEIFADNIATDILDDNGAGTIDIRDARLNISIGGTTYGTANGLATLDGGGKIPVAQIPDVVTGGLDAKGSCRAKTTTTLPAYTAAGSQVGKTMTANANGALPNIDGVNMSVGNRLLVDQFGSASNVDNGIYVITQLGSGGAPWILTRATDADQTGEVSTGTYTFVEEGNTAAITGFIVDTVNPIVVDTTPITWSIFSSSLVGVTNSNNTGLGIATFASVTSATQNVGIGYFAMNALTSGTQNASLGYQSLLNATTGSQNVAVGSHAMRDAAGAATQLVAVGYNVLRNVTTGTGNTMIGYTAGQTLTTGSRNTGVGYASLFDLLGASDNTAFGYLAGENITGGSRNTTVGASALASCTIGSENTAMGQNAMLNVVSGSSNTALGYRAAETMSANNVTAIGHLALLNATGNNNTSVGKSSGNAVTSGTGNTLLGATAETNVGNALDRIAIGRAAVVTGDYSAQIGESVVSTGAAATLTFRTQVVCDEDWTTTAAAVAIIDANGNMTKGSGLPLSGLLTADNTGVGVGALNSLGAGVDNSAYGVNALNTLTSGNENTAVGDNALVSVMTGVGNVGIGSAAGNTINSSNYNTCVGTNAQVSDAARTQQIALGYNATPNNTNFSAQIGRNANDSVGVMRYKSQVVSQESWIGTGALPAQIDNNGNIVKSGAFTPGVARVTAATATPGPSSTGDPVLTAGINFFTITGTAGSTTGVLGNGTVDGQELKLVVVTMTAGVFFDIDTIATTTMRDAVGRTVNYIRFTEAGNSVHLLWDATLARWYINGSGASLF